MITKHKTTSEIHAFILSQIETHPGDITRLTAEKFNISTQAVRKHLQSLLNDGLIHASGATRDRTYSLQVIDELELSIPITEDLAEDAIWRKEIRPRFDGVETNVINICQYGFTEMVNNVLDHSEGQNLSLRYRRTAANIELVIADDGIGIFNKISRILGMPEKIHVILELAKGKLTTDPSKHTGEGIFFTSRAFDNFMILSGNLMFAHTEADNDWLLEEQQDLYDGTYVRLRIRPNSDRKLRDLFDKYASGDDYGFSRTHIPVTLARYGDENLVSRSQAKRLLSRFERFEEIILDFSGVEMIGQAFADEVFRVFTSQHPTIHLTYVDANQQVENMILRALPRNS